jgi:hypothetical protein
VGLGLFAHGEVAMTLVRLPRQYDSSYSPGRGPALLLTCMDLRLLDEVVQFMDHDGLTNRYDHVIFAGASLGALGKGPKPYDQWRKTFRDHLGLAYDLHHIKDVYVIEHRDCGAYREFLEEEGTFNDDQAEEELACHRKYAKLLKLEIEDWAKEREKEEMKKRKKPAEKVSVNLSFKAFLMDLRGGVTPIVTS